MNINFRLILSLLGYLFTTIGVLMTLPALIDFYMDADGSKTFFMFSLIITFFGLLLAFSNKQEQKKPLSTKDGLILTVVAWVSIVGLSALPLKFGYLQLSYTDAYFEMMSAFSTTGATTIPNLDVLSYGFHFWRALMQWIGGLGIIVAAVVLMPSLQGGGMQLFKMESFETFDNAIDKAKKIAYGMVIIYICITIIIIFALLYLGNLSFFDSLIHSLTSVSTAGFSNKNSSVAYFNNPTMEVILIFAMISGSLPYILLYNLFFLRKSSIFKDQQVMGFFKIIILVIMILSVWLYFNNGIHYLTSLRYASFTVVSLITGTGFVSYNYSLFGNFPVMLLFIAMFIGGCAGSTACGIKIYRFQVAYALGVAHLDKLFLRKHVSVPFYNGNPIHADMGMGVLVYLFIFFIILGIGSVLLSTLDLDFITALSAVAACLTNVGPGLGKIIGPVGTFNEIPDLGKWLLSIIMLLGRLEIFGVLIILSRKFWL
ncbi:MAG: TrkH family potassium uptake protein [Alphaproteobacteria bacterium]|jgi:trk system potassium uptake protein TrkH|nr:TrkH family potassium uptake protein [Alphaproteobacteria bacterium]